VGSAAEVHGRPAIGHARPPPQRGIRAPGTVSRITVFKFDWPARRVAVWSIVAWLVLAATGSREDIMRRLPVLSVPIATLAAVPASGQKGAPPTPGVPKDFVLPTPTRAACATVVPRPLGRASGDAAPARADHAHALNATSVSWLNEQP